MYLKCILVQKVGFLKYKWDIIFTLPASTLVLGPTQLPLCGISAVYFLRKCCEVVQLTYLDLIRTFNVWIDNYTYVLCLCA